jgi:hypothetical protein
MSYIVCGMILLGLALYDMALFGVVRQGKVRQGINARSGEVRHCVDVAM